MTSVDASKSVNVSSDQLFNHICGSCKTDGKDAEARKYCENCAEYLCDSCADFHRKLPLLRNHNVVPASNISGEKPNRRLKDYCACNTNQEVAFYCEDHTEFICSSCQTIKHHRCTIPSIQEKCAGYTASNMDLILAKTQSLKDAYDRLKKKCQENESELERSKDSCKEEIQAFRKEIDEFLNKLEQKMLAELDQCVNKESQRINEHIKTLTTAIQMLDQDNTSLDKAQKDGSKGSMFIAETRVSTNLLDYQTRLDDLGKSHFNIRLSFERDAGLIDLQKSVEALGTLKCLEKEVQTSQKLVFLGCQIQYTRTANARLSEDTVLPSITGYVFMPNGCLVACDYDNCTIKLFDSSLSLQDSLKLPSNPYDVSVINDNTVIVTLHYQKQLQYVQVFPRITMGNVIQLDTYCWGVAVSGQEIYVSCRNPSEVQVLDKQGNLKQRLGIRKDGSSIFSAPYNIAVSQAGNKIFVSDEGNKSVTCMAVDGSIIYQFKDSNLKKPRGLICDEEDNVMVCDRYSNNIHVINSNGKKHGILSLSGQNERRPRSVAYRRSDNKLVVGCYRFDHLLVCQLTN